MKAYLVTIVAAGGLLLWGCSRSVESASQKFNELPPAVQKTVRAQAPNAEIADVSHKTQDGMDVYQVEFAEPGKNPKLMVAADGKLLNTDMPKPAGAVERLLTPTGATGTKLSALPEAAQKTILSKAPNKPISNISRHEKDGRVFYEVEFNDNGNRSTMEVAEGGTVVQDLQNKSSSQPVAPTTTP
jgi:uncharacterized membrane protein YkoI